VPVRKKEKLLFEEANFSMRRSALGAWRSQFPSLAHYSALGERCGLSSAHHNSIYASAASPRRFELNHRTHLPSFCLQTEQRRFYCAEQKKARKKDSFKTLLNRFYLLVHPDLFSAHPTEKARKIICYSGK